MELLPHLWKKKNKKTTRDKKKCVKTCWCFIVWTKDATSLKFHMWFLSLWWYQRKPKIFSHCTASMSGVKRCCMSPLPPSPLSLSLSFFLSSPLLPPSHLHSTHAPLLCVLLLHLCSDYSSIGSHADVAIGRYADLAIDTHKRPRRSLQGYSELACIVISLSLCLLAEPKCSFLPVYWHKKNVKADIVAIRKIRI